MYNPSESREIIMGSSTRPSSIDGVLDIGLHHATHIHNICIYGKQDVYAKFSITHTEDAVYSTQAIRGGGKNPVFNQSLQIMVSKIDAVLKCEIWMMSCMRTYLEDQLLGFVLIPLCDLFGQGRVTKDYSLSSTDLFHNPAGILSLSLTFYLRGTDMPVNTALSNMSPVCTQKGLHNVEKNDIHEARGNNSHEIITANTHDTVMNANQGMTRMEYDNIDFPDVQGVCENQRMVSVYLDMALATDANMDEDECGKEDQHDEIRMGVKERDLSDACLLQLGSSPMTQGDSEMGVPKGEETMHDGPWSPSCNFASQDDKDVVSSRDTPTSSKAKEVECLDSTSTVSVKALSHSTTISSPTSGVGLSSPVVVSSANGQESQSSFTAPLVTISLEPEEPNMQQQIADMYKKSMQQFTESLAKMKLPLDLDNAQSQVEVSNEACVKKAAPTTNPTHKDGHKVFYGSRAFF